MGLKTYNAVVGFYQAKYLMIMGTIMIVLFGAPCMTCEPVCKSGTCSATSKEHARSNHLGPLSEDWTAMTDQSGRWKPPEECCALPSARAPRAKVEQLLERTGLPEPPSPRALGQRSSLSFCGSGNVATSVGGWGSIPQASPSEQNGFLPNVACLRRKKTAKALLK